MFKRALIVLEPGRYAGDVILAGLALARALHAEVVFHTTLSAGQTPVADLPDMEVARRRVAMHDLRSLTSYVHAQAQRDAEARGVSSRSQVATTVNDVIGSIVEAARLTASDVIVVGTDPANAVTRLLNGSIVPGLVTASPMPVLVCPPRAAENMSLDRAVMRLLVVLEGGETGGVARNQGLSLARLLGAELLFVRITPHVSWPMVDVAGLAAAADDRIAVEVQAHSQRLVAAACRLAARAALSARGTSLPAGTTARDIAAMAAEQGCALIVAGHHSTNAVMRLLSGSLVPGLITAATMPVLTCRGPTHGPRRSPPRRRVLRHRAAAAAQAAQARGR